VVEAFVKAEDDFYEVRARYNHQVHFSWAIPTKV
jgi:hypothetical protein